MAALANELIDLVIDQLRDDEPSLRTCSLVSRQWIPRSRLYNFSSAKLVIDIDTIEMRDGIQFAPGAMRLDAFMDLLSSPLATFIGSLRDLTLHHTLDGNEYTPMNIPPPMYILRRLEARGVRLCKLDLSCNAFFTFPHEGPRPFTSSLTALDIDLLDADDETRLSFVFDFVCSYPKLEQLTLMDGNVGLEIGTLMALELPPSLRSLTTGYLPLVKWIGALEVPPTHINTLRLLDAGYSWFPWDGLIVFLSGPIGHNIHTLVFTNIEVGEHTRSNYRLDFSNFYNLRHLQVARRIYESVPGTLLYLLSHLHRSPARKTIEILTTEAIIGHDMDTHPASELWRTLDNMLSSQEDWPALRSVNIRGAAHRRVGEPEGPIVDKFSAAFHRHLPECVRRGLLEVDLWDEKDRDTEN
ncbi:hypothetical protein C8F01DRAFT_321475 [Mycena amicta]|nr:hypothetical protein C8F01DRAFT_321475 [Mycena amicta]